MDANDIAKMNAIVQGSISFKMWLVGLFFLFAIAPSFAQELTWEEFMDNLADCEWATNEDLADLTIELTDLHEHPLDINAASRDELSELPFLSPEAVMAILDYRARYGPLRSLGELRLIERVSWQERRWLHLFCYVEDPEAQSLAHRHPRYEVTTRLDIPLYERNGWSWERGVAHRIQFRFEGPQALVQAPAGGQWFAGLRAERDAGEPMFTREVPTWDAMGGYAGLCNAGWLRTFIVGDFKVSWGEGLVMNTGFMLGKTSMGMWRTTGQVKPLTGHDEVRHLRGIATTVEVGKGTEVSAFYSRRLLDATLDEEGACRTILATGLHRTESELARRRNLISHTSGLHLQWEHRAFRLGATGIYQAFDRIMNPGDALYRQYAPRGYHFGTAAVDYSLRLYPFFFSGETAHNFASPDNGWATLNKGAWRINANTQLSVIQRYYSYRYFSHHASAFGENSDVQNESGVCVALDADRVGPLTINAYADFFYSPWPRYTMTRSSQGSEVMGSLQWQSSRRWSILLRYKCKSKEQSDQRYVHHTLRTTWLQHLNALWELSTSAFATWRRLPAQSSTSRGYALMPRLTHRSPSNRWQWALAAALFRTDDFQSRIYAYEPSVLQSFGFTSLYGRGARIASTLRYLSPTRQWLIQAKIGCTRFTDREFQSSGALLIASPWKADAQILIRLKW